MIDIGKLTTIPYSQIATFIAANEGLRLKSYKCTAGKLTVGIGHNCSAIPTFPIIGKYIIKMGQEITHEDAVTLFKVDLLDVLESAHKHHPNFINLAPNFQLVVIDMIFQLGSAGYGKWPKFKKAINLQDRMAAAAELKDSSLYQQTPNRVKARITLLYDFK